MADQLRDIQRYMAFIGWKGDAPTGFSHKEDVNGNIIARAHDATWIADVEEATAHVERIAIIHEIERREQERQP